MAQQFQPQLLAPLVTVFQRDERLDRLADDRIGLADHAGLGHCRVLHQRALDFERPYQVPGDLITSSARPTNQYNHRRHAAPGRRSGRGRRRNTCDSALPRSGSLEHRRPASAQRQFAFDIGLFDHLHRAILASAHDEGLDAGSGFPIEPA